MDGVRVELLIVGVGRRTQDAKNCCYGCGDSCAHEAARTRILHLRWFTAGVREFFNRIGVISSQNRRMVMAGYREDRMSS
jgi:hypothetical protein